MFLIHCFFSSSFFFFSYNILGRGMIANGLTIGLFATLLFYLDREN